MPDDLKEVMHKANNDATMRMAEYIEDRREELLKQFSDEGIELTTLFKEEQVKVKDITEPVLQKWINDMRKKGFNAQDVLDYYLKRIEFYSDS